MKTGDLFDVTNALLDRYADAEGLTSDYAIAKSLGCSKNTIRNYRKQKHKMDATTAVQIAERLRLDPLMVIAKVNTERSKNPRIRTVWEKYSGRLLLAAVVALTPIADQPSAQNDLRDATTYTLYAYLLRILHGRATAGKQFFLSIFFITPSTKKMGRSPANPLYFCYRSTEK